MVDELAVEHRIGAGKSVTEKPHWPPARGVAWPKDRDDLFRPAGTRKGVDDYVIGSRAAKRIGGRRHWSVVRSLCDRGRSAGEEKEYRAKCQLSGYDSGQAEITKKTSNMHTLCLNARNWFWFRAVDIFIIPAAPGRGYAGDLPRITRMGANRSKAK
jgi:hypothetical protein